MEEQESKVVFRTGLHPQDPATALVRVGVAEHELVRSTRLALATEYDLTQFVWGVLNQGNSSTCWAHSAVALKYIRDAINNGTEAVLQSPLFFAQCMYAVYREQATKAGKELPKLFDNGAQLDDADKCFAEWGSQPFGEEQQGGGTDVPATSDDLGNPIALPELDATRLEEGMLKAFAGEYDITTDGNAPETVAACVQAKTPVWLGGLVDQAVMDLQPGHVEQLSSPDAPNAGGHARAIVGFRTVAGKLQFKVLNSWGARWCEAGYSWVSADVVTGAWSLLPFKVL